MSDTIIAPVTSDTDLQDYDRLAHIVLEGYTPNEGEPNAGEFIPIGNSVVEGFINGTAVRALCGKVWVPDRNPQKYPLCGTCKDVAESRGWSVPQ